MRRNEPHQRAPRAQAVIELAVFGAILLFIVAAIIQQGSGAAFSQDIQLQAMRRALLMSYRESHPDPNGLCPTCDSMARNTASYLLVEDRLSPSVGQYGAIDRQPLIAMGSGTMTKNLLKPIDWSDFPQDLPRMDMRVNGQDFVLTTAAAAVYRVRRDMNSGVVEVYANAKDCDVCSLGTAPSIRVKEPDSVRIFHRDDLDAAKRLQREWSSWPMGGYPPFYSVAVRGSAEWRDTDLDRRYDLQRDGDPSNDLSEELRKKIPWQWTWSSLSELAAQIDLETGFFPSADVDGDKVEEVVYAIKALGDSSCGSRTWRAYEVAVLDPNAGDMYSDSERAHYADPDDIPGLRQETDVFTWTCRRDSVSGECVEPSLFEVREGRLYDPNTNELVSSVNWKRQFDVITRIFQMNKRMIGNGSLCTDTYPAIPQAPIEVCCPNKYCCATPGNFYKTCFSMADKKLFIRSRIEDYRGHRWVTKTAGE